MALQRIHHQPTDLLAADQGKSSAGNLGAELIGHSGSRAGNGFTDDRKRSGIARMRMHNPVHMGQMTIDVTMRGGIGRGLEFAFQNPTVQIGDDHVFRSQIIKAEAAGLDDYSLAGHIAGADVAARPSH